MKNVIRSEFIKIKHTSYWRLHIILPVIGALLYIAYFAIYVTAPVISKEKLLLELTATIFPLLISTVTGLNSSLEEKASHFQRVLSSKKRVSIWNGKLAFLILTGLFSALLLMSAFWFGIKILAIADISLLFCIGAGFILLAGNIIIYIWHLFLSYRFGIGISLFFGVFESLQVILYSNITLAGVFRYIPFAWGVELCHSFINTDINMLDIMIIGLLTGLALLVTCIWINYWDGRKNHE